MGNNNSCLQEKDFYREKYVRIAAADSIKPAMGLVAGSINIFYNNIAGQDGIYFIEELWVDITFQNQN